MPEDKGNIIPVDVKDEMKDAYLNYAMSVDVYKRQYSNNI